MAMIFSRHLITLLLCYLASSITSVTIEEPAMASDFAITYETSGMLEKIGFSQVIGEALESMNETYKPKENGKVDFQCAQILTEIFSKIPTIEADTLARMIGRLVKETLGLQNETINSLKAYLDEDYDRFMGKVSQSITVFDHMRREGLITDEFRNDINYLSYLFKRLRQLQRKGPDRSFEDSIRSVYRIYLALPSLATVRSEICVKSIIFDFSRETFARNFDGFFWKVRRVAMKHVVDETGFEKYVRKFVDYFDEWLDYEAKEGLYRNEVDLRFLKNRLKIAMSVILRPTVYWMVVEDFSPYNDESSALYRKAMRALNLTTDEEDNTQVNATEEDKNAHLPILVSTMKDPDTTMLACKLGVMYHTSTVQSIYAKEGFNETADSLCVANRKLQVDLLNFAKKIGTMVDIFETMGLSPEAVTAGKAALLPGTVYPEDSLNPKDLYPNLAAETARSDYVMPALKKLAPQFFPEVEKRVKRLIDIMYGAPACN